MSTVQEEAPLPCSKDLPGSGDALAFKTAATTISMHVARTAKTAVTCLAKVMVDDALQAVGLLPHPPSTAQAQAQASTPAGLAQDRERRALRGKLTRFIADTMMGGADEVKDGSWPAGAPPFVQQRIAADLKAVFPRVLSMKFSAELAITLPETRRQGCWPPFLPLLI
eukprot:contig_9820_g2345